MDIRGCDLTIIFALVIIIIFQHRRRALKRRWGNGYRRLSLQRHRLSFHRGFNFFRLSYLSIGRSMLINRKVRLGHSRRFRLLESGRLYVLGKLLLKGRRLNVVRDLLLFEGRRVKIIRKLRLLEARDMDVFRKRTVIQAGEVTVARDDSFLFLNLCEGRWRDVRGKTSNLIVYERRGGDIVREVVDALSAANIRRRGDVRRQVARGVFINMLISRDVNNGKGGLRTCVLLLFHCLLAAPHHGLHSGVRRRKHVRWEGLHALRLINLCENISYRKGRTAKPHIGNFIIGQLTNTLDTRHIGRESGHKGGLLDSLILFLAVKNETGNTSTESGNTKDGHHNRHSRVIARRGFGPTSGVAGRVTSGVGVGVEDRVTDDNLARTRAHGTARGNRRAAASD
eukprot:Colp12_sorted_trinity150504_noHs@11046